MTARNWPVWLKFALWLIAGLLVLVLLLALFGKTLAITYLSPPEHFELEAAPRSPDYSNAYFWVAHPDKADSSDLIPAHVNTEDDLSDKPVDVFFIHSTGYVGPGGWNSTMAVENSEAQSNEYMLSSMASIFNACCEIYAPHYREAHLKAFLSGDNASAFGALDLAYTDVEQAFFYFLQHFSKGRPFIIVSHSQGTSHALRLIAQHIDNSPVASRMVAAYTLGYWLPMDMFERNFDTIEPCKEPQQTGCIVSFDTYGEGGYRSGSPPQWYKSGWEINASRESLCVNPLSWQSNSVRELAQQHLGAMPVEFKRTPVDMLMARNPGYKFSQLPALVTSLTWAQCQQDGRLEIAEQLDNAFANHLENADKSYHILDFSLFYGNIRDNAKLRTRAYLSRFDINNRSKQ
jgi:hypothetical protein